MFTKNLLKNDFDKNFEEFLSSDFNKTSINDFIESNIASKKDKPKVKNFWNDQDDDDSSSSKQIGVGKSFLKSSRVSTLNNKIELNEEKISDSEFENEKIEETVPSYKGSHRSFDNYEEQKNNDFHAHPITFEGDSDTIMERTNNLKLAEMNFMDMKIQNTLNNGVETMKSNITSIPIDKSHDDLQYSMDRTEKEEHLLSKVSLMDSMDGHKLDKTGIKLNNQNSITTTGAVTQERGFETDIHNLNRTSESYYKNSINPASGDSYNYTQGITNVTDTIIGDTTAADLAAIHRQYEKYNNKSSDEMTPDAKVLLSETVKEICEEKSSYHYDVPSEINLDSTLNSKSFGLKVINPENQSSPVPTPRLRTRSIISQADKMDNDESVSFSNKLNKKIDTDERPKSSRYSHVKSSGYGTKSIITTEKLNQKDPSVISTKSQNLSSARGRHNQQNVNVSGKISNQTFVRPQRNQEMKSHDRSKSAPRSNYTDHSAVSPTQNETGRYYGRHNESEDSYNMASDSQNNIKVLKPVQSNGKNKEWHEKWLEERKMVKKLQAESIFHDRDFKLKIETSAREYEAKISQLESQVNRLKQQLQTKPDFSDKSLGPSVTKEDIARIEKEMKEQNSILSAYEKDNERLCQEIKVLKQHRKGEDKIESMENERLISQLVTIKAELDSKEIELRNLKQIVKENRISDQSGRGVENKQFYLQEIGDLKNELRDLNKRYLMCDTERNNAETKLNRIIFETEKQIAQYKNELETEKVEREKLKEIHKIEVDDLKRKIKWYLDNQAILDQNTKKLKVKDNEIAELKNQLEISNTVKISSNIRAKEKLADAAKIKRLEEEILTLKEDLYALAKGKNVAHIAEKRTIQFLEERIKSLEYDNNNLCNKESNAFRSLQQQFESIKYQYEEKIRDLELDLMKKCDNKIQPEKNARITELKLKIDELNNDLNKKSLIINRLKLEIKRSSNKVVNDESRLNKEGKAKNIRKVELDHRTSEMLMKEIRDKNVEIERLKIQNNYLKNNMEPRKEVENFVNLNLPTSTQLVELQAENVNLNSKIIYLTQDIENHRQKIDELKLSAIRNEEAIREQYDRQMRELEEYHRGNLNNVKIDYAKRHSESDMGNLQSQIEIQKTYITHLQNQVTDNNIKLKSVESLENELADSKKHVQTLTTELSDLRLIWSRKPALEMIDKLRWKINQLEEKENFRGRQLDEYIEKVVKQNTKQYQSEVERWRSIVTKKNQNLKHVQEELNRLLEALEELKRQGITIPKFDKI